MSASDDFIDQLFEVDKPTKAQIRKAKLPKVKTRTCHCRPWQRYTCPGCKELSK